MLTLKEILGHLTTYQFLVKPSHWHRGRHAQNTEGAVDQTAFAKVNLITPLKKIKHSNWDRVPEEIPVAMTVTGLLTLHKLKRSLYITGSVQSEIQQSAIRVCYFIQARVTKSSSTDFQSPSNVKIGPGAKRIRTSHMMLKMYGDSRHTCLTPFRTLNQSLLPPTARTFEFCITACTVVQAVVEAKVMGKGHFRPPTAP